MAEHLAFSKISTNGQRVHIEWTTRTSAENKEKIYHRIENEKSPPHPDFGKAMQAMVGWVLDTLELPLPYGSTLTVTGLSISEDNAGRLGLIITATKRLEKHDGTVVLNTPLIRRPLADENTDDLPDVWLLFDDKLRKYLDAAMDRAEEYISGRREQGNLFDQTLPQGAAT